MLIAAALTGGGLAHAQDVALPESAAPAQTAPGKEGEPEIAVETGTDIDLANVVTSAAKGVTTVQEAPSIITIITADEIKSRGFHFINDALSTVPGWLQTSALGNQAQIMMVRGVTQGMLLLHDGISMFDPWGNLAAVNRYMPMENIKRIEVVTGPGGVLWGANSFLGIVNVIMKDAEDVNGLEVNAGYGDGPGNVQDARAYGMFGKTFLHGKLKIFQHASFESYIGDVYTLPQFVVSSPGPQPAANAYYGSVINSWPQRSWLLTLDGKYSFGPVSLYYNVPVGDLHNQLTLANEIVPHDFLKVFDRYGILEYKSRFWKDRLGVTVKGYYTQFVRDGAFQLYEPNSAPGFPVPGSPSPAGGLLSGGLRLVFDQGLIQRGGGTVDGDLNLPFGIRLLGGGEVFYESSSNQSVRFDQDFQPSAQLPLYCPVDANHMAIPTCPRRFLFDASRVVVAGYVSAQWRPFTKLTLDAGVRLQQGFGNLPYQFTPLYSGSLVWNFLPDFHLKANYATGFRAPVFENSRVAPGGVQFGSDPRGLVPEASQSFQGEVNARLLRNVRKVRELELRVDYSYTFLEHVITILHATYSNTGKRAIHSVEGYAKLYLNGDHFIQASYTYLNGTATDQGVLRNVPNHWMTLGASFSVLKHHGKSSRGLGDIALDLNTNLTVLGAYEDPNRYVSSGNGPSYAPPLVPGGPPQQTTVSRVTDITVDRLTPVALLQLGFRLRFLRERISMNAQFYNVLNQHFFYPDPFNDLTPSVEMTPTPAPGFNFFASVSYHP